MRNTFLFAIKTKALSIILILLFLFTSSFEIKIAIVFILLFLILKYVQTIHKKYIRALLIFIFSFAFIYSPYWHVLVTHHILKYVCLIIFFLAGIGWAYASARDLRLPKVRIEIPSLLLLSTMLYAINYRFLNIDIAYRGDEDFHVNRVLDLLYYFNFFWQQRNIYINQNQSFWLFSSFLLFVVCYFIFLHKLITGRFKKIFRYIAISVLLSLVPLSAVILFPENVFREHKYTEIYSFLAGVLRYPFFQTWLDLFFVVPNIYQNISLYRALPFLSLLFIAIFLFYQFEFRLKNKLLSVSFSFVFCTVPIFLFYSNILYLEMPVIFLMLVSVFYLKTFVKADSLKLKENPVWYCILLMAFLKETAMIYLLLIILLRIGYSFFHDTKSKLRKRFIDELMISVLLLLPILLFLLLRKGPGPYMFYINNIVTPFTYVELNKSFIVQMGALAPLAFLGWIHILRKKDIFNAITLTILFLGILLYFLTYVFREYIVISKGLFLIGYSRWNLYLLPVILYLAFLFIIGLKNRYRIIFLIILLASNMLLFPFKVDGTRLPNWGSPHADIAEYTYPYNESIAWLSKQHTVKNLVLLGQYYPYFGMRYYFEKYAFHPTIHDYPFGETRPNEQIERKMLQLFFDKLAGGKLDKKMLIADTFFYHSTNNINLDIHILYGKKYKIVKRIQNSLHSIYIFQKV